jgi:hypothetical protein
VAPECTVPYLRPSVSSSAPQQKRKGICLT